MAHQIHDPGFGIKIGRNASRIVNADGTMNVRRYGERWHPSDVYHALLTMSWTRFILSSILAYVLLNVAFGFVYQLIGTEHILNSPESTWIENLETAMFFSAQTITTVGYGNLAPGTPLVSAIAALEALLGLFVFGIFTGISFGRFSRIRPRITFSTTAIIAPFRDSTNAFMFRIVNERSSIVMDPSAQLMCVMQSSSAKDAPRRYYQLPLDVPKISSLAMNWTLVHPITKDSPLWGLTEGDLHTLNAEFLVIITAIDDSVGQSFYARGSYVANEVVWGRRFEQMFWTDDVGTVELHLETIHDTIPAELYPIPRTAEHDTVMYDDEVER